MSHYSYLRKLVPISVREPYANLSETQFTFVKRFHANLLGTSPGFGKGIHASSSGTHPVVYDTTGLSLQ